MTANTSRSGRSVIDSGYAWVVTFASFLCMIIADGQKYSYAMLLTDLAESLSVNTATAASPCAIALGLCMMSGLFYAPIVQRFGHRKVAAVGSILACASLSAASFSTQAWHLLLSYGLLGGMSMGMMYFPSNVIVSQYQDKNRAVANGIVAAGSSIGVLVLPSLTKALDANYGWRGAMLLNAALLLQGVPSAMLYREVDSFQVRKASVKVDEKPIGAGGEVRVALDLLRDVHMLLYLLSIAFYTLAFYSLFMYLPSVVLQCGGSGTEQALVMVVVGSVSAVARVASSAIASNLSLRGKLVLHGACVALVGVLCMFVQFFTRFWMVVSFAALESVLLGPCAALTLTIVTELFGVQKVKAAFGWVCIVRGVCCFAGPPLAGAVRDLTGSFGPSYVVSGVLFVLTAIVICLLLLVIAKKTPKHAPAPAPAAASELPTSSDPAETKA